MPNKHERATPKKETDGPEVTSNMSVKMLFFYLFDTPASLPFPSLSAPLLLSIICRTLWFAELGFNPGKGLQ